MIEQLCHGAREAEIAAARAAAAPPQPWIPTRITRVTEPLDHRLQDGNDWLQLR
jgi:hypothetical protein